MAEVIQRLPHVGDMYVHNSTSATYKVIAVANTDARDPTDWPVTVVYVSSTGQTWARPAHEFRAKFHRLQHK